VPFPAARITAASGRVELAGSVIVGGLATIRLRFPDG
jgi:hypothetical protein